MASKPFSFSSYYVPSLIFFKREFRKKPDDKNNQNIKGNDLNSNNQTGENKND